MSHDKISIREFTDSEGNLQRQDISFKDYVKKVADNHKTGYSGPILETKSIDSTQIGGIGGFPAFSLLNNLATKVAKITNQANSVTDFMQKVGEYLRDPTFGGSVSAPKKWDTFVRGLAISLGIGVANDGYAAGGKAGDATEAELNQLKSYQSYALPNAPNALTQEELTDIFDKAIKNPVVKWTVIPAGTDQETLSKAAFNHFISNMDFSNIGSNFSSEEKTATGTRQTTTNETRAVNFFNDWNYFTTNVAKSNVNLPNHLTYDQFHAAFKDHFGTQTLDQAYSLFTNFTTGKDGYHLDSHNVNLWIEHLRQKSTPLSVDELKSVRFKQAKIMSELFTLLVDMITAIQRVATTQAQQLNALSKWQKAYADLLQNVPVFTEDDGSALSANADDRTEANKKMEGYQENIRTNRSLVSDTAKQFQSQVKQSQEAAKAMGAIITSILQTQSGIVATLFR